jgi:hypothetical protein
VAAVEALAAGQRIRLAQIRLRDRLKDRVKLIKQLRSRGPEALPRPLGEHNQATIETANRSSRAVACHEASTSSATDAIPANARVNRSACSVAGRACRYRSVVVIRE